MAEHIVDTVIKYPAYTSASANIDGYPVDGKYVVHFVIESVTGRNMAGYGNNFESEVLFRRGSYFFVDKIEFDSSGTPIIYITEATKTNE